MADNSINITRGTGTEYVGFDVIDATGTATAIYVQYVKIIDGRTDGGVRQVVNAAGAMLVEHTNSATVAVSLTSLPSTATIPVTFTSQPTAATLAVFITNSSASAVWIRPVSTATMPVSLATLPTLPTTATMPVTITNTGLPSTATIAVTVTSLPTAATQAVFITNTATVSLSTAATYPVTFTSQPTAATLAVTFTAQPTAATLAVAVQNLATVAHDTAIGGNPLVIAGRSLTAADAANSNQVSADADVVRAAFSRDGALYSLPHNPRIWRAFYDGVAATVDGSVKTSTATAHSLYVGTIFCGVNGAGAIFLSAGTGTASQIWKHFFATAGDGAVAKFNPPIKLAATTDLLVTSVATTFSITITGYTAP